MTVIEERTRCFVLASAKTTGDHRLETALAEHPWACSIRNDAHALMAELCLDHRAESNRAAWGLQRRESLVLVSGTDAASRALADAVRRYLPGIEIWSFDGERLHATHPGGWREVVDVSARAEPRPTPPPPPLRLAGGPMSEPTTVAGHDDDEDERIDESRADIDVTQEELAMLLAFDPPTGDPEP